MMVTTIGALLWQIYGALTRTVNGQSRSGSVPGGAVRAAGRPRRSGPLRGASHVRDVSKSTRRLRPSWSDDGRWPAAARAGSWAFLGASLLLAVQRWRLDVPWDRFHLPAFDGHVYYTMAELPRVFSVAPWGYRVLTPWLAAWLPTSQPTLAFALLTLFGLAATAALLVALGRALGGSPLLLAAWALLFVVSGRPPDPRLPVPRRPSRPGPGMRRAARRPWWQQYGLLAALLLLAAAAKEANLVLLPAVAALLTQRRGWRSGLQETAVAAVPALIFLATLRAAWAPEPVSLPAPPVTCPCRASRPLSGWSSDVPWLVLAIAATLGLFRGRGPRRAGSWRREPVWRPRTSSRPISRPTRCASPLCVARSMARAATVRHVTATGRRTCGKSARLVPLADRGCARDAAGLSGGPVSTPTSPPSATRCWSTTLRTASPPPGAWPRENA